MGRTGRLVLVVILLLGLTWTQPASAVRGAESPTGATLVGEEIGTSPELLPASELPPPGGREIGYVNGRYLILNMHGALFTNSVKHFQENIAYAEWMNAGVIRVFATDAGEFIEWPGERVGARIAQVAPMLRAANLKLIVALVNNHQPVPGEYPDSFGYMDEYFQLLLPFYQGNWRGPYLAYIRGLIGTVVRYGAQDVVWAWELGNELHTPRQPRAVMPFLNTVSLEVRRLDPTARILPGTMGVNHLEPGVPASPVARALYCYGPISAYTLHAYDWQSPDYPGDMPIDWDFENIVNRPCPNGRRLPVIVEELGTSREVPGLYTAEEEDIRLEQELNQIRMVLKQDGVVAIGTWSAESPHGYDLSRWDHRRGLTSYGENAEGGGSCFRLAEGESSGVRCQLERALRALPTSP